MVPWNTGGKLASGQPVNDSGRRIDRFTNNRPIHEEVFVSEIGFNTTYFPAMYGTDDAGQGNVDGMNAQSASGALAAYMRQNNLTELDPNALYALAYNPAARTSSTVSHAAKWMLRHSDTYNTIEQHDVSGSDGISGVSNFEFAAQGGLAVGDDSDGACDGDEDEEASDFDAQSASGALASYMAQNNIGSLNPNQLYELAYNPPATASPTVSAAAKWMLQHPNTFNKIETHDVPGADGIAGANDFEWEAQGGLGMQQSGGGQMDGIIALLIELEESIMAQQFQTSLGEDQEAGLGGGSEFGEGFGMLSGLLRA